MLVISPQQIRAARALINWSQQKLADACGVSLNALNNIEREVGNPRQKTLMSIRKSLEEQGIVFIEDTGAKLQSESFEVDIFSGDNIVTEYFNELDNALKMGVKEFLFGDLDNARYAEVMPKILTEWKKFGPKLRENECKTRNVMKENDKAIFFNPNIDVYREIITSYFGTIPYTVYGNNVAVVIWGPPMKLIVFQNKSIAEIFRAQFNMNWEQGTPLSEKRHKEGLKRGDKIK